MTPGWPQIEGCAAWVSEGPRCGCGIADQAACPGSARWWAHRNGIPGQLLPAGQAVRPPPKPCPVGARTC
jgi:hypothetical protein